MIYLLNATGRLTAFEEQLKSIVARTLGEYASVHNVGPVDVVIAENPTMSIPGHGVGGYTSTAHELYIPLDLRDGDTKENIDKHLAPTMIHELSHIVRLQAGLPLAGHGNLGDNVIAEGLADHMSLSLYPDQDTPWIKSLTDDEFARMKLQFLDEREQQHYDHNAWFYGAKYANIPPWAGYSLGYSIVAEYLESQQMPIAKALLLSTDEVLSAWISSQKK